VDEPETPVGPAKVRLDKWLWAARFYKTRSQATEAIGAGHVKLQGQRTKAGQSVSAGVTLEIVKEQLTWEVLVVAVSDKRGKGADAAKLYCETEAGRTRRERTLEELRTAAPAYLAGRPTKRDRRAMDRWKAGHGG
jgi:ribosome-associated heat shock protein Hsp15